MAMRKHNRKNGVSVQAIAGSHVVLLAMNTTEAARKGLAGFAVGVVTPAGTKWLKGFKFFESLVPHPKPGERRSTLEHPVQSYLWGHYSAAPGRDYNYVVRPLYFPADGDPGKIEAGEDVAVSVRTQSPEEGTHSVFFNRGAIVSQAFAERFGNKAPQNIDDADDEEVKWLSRGLLEAALGFIAQAKDADFELRCCFYELTYKPILDALKAAAINGAAISVIYEAGHVKADGTFEETAIGKSNIEAVKAYSGTANLSFIKRTKHISIPHNKFMILRKKAAPDTFAAEMVWTGSTNISKSGFLGQTNVGHIVRDTGVAGQFDRYWDIVSTDPDRADLKAWVKANNPQPAGLLAPETTTVVFSPRGSKAMLDWYGDRIDEATRTVMLTAAFGVTRELAERFNNDRDYLRFLLMEKENASPETQAMLKRDRDTKIALGKALGKVAIARKIDGWKLDKWFLDEEHFRKSGNIFYIHTKIMMIDPFGDDPLIFTGSANFSPASLTSNDENMLLIRGNPDVADVYATEFFRLFNHFYFRTVANAVALRGTAGNPADKAVFLDQTDDWTDTYFKDGSYHQRRRILFGVDPE
jgi:phosphatidylserine/phosphatidylglycerophosphate/cardiolipin synthase-like enzyme